MISFLASFGIAEWLVGIGAICSVVGTLMLGIRQGKDQVEMRDKIITEQRNLVTGGDSFFFLRPTKVVNTDDVLLITEFNGSYPMYDVTIDVQEFDRVLQGNSYVYQETSTYSTQIGTIHPLKSSTIFKAIKLPNKDFKQFGKRYSLKISSRNGFVEEDIYLRGLSSGYSQAFKVVQFLPKYNEKNRAFPLDKIEARVKKIDEGFPMSDLEHLEGDSGWNRDYQSE